MLEGDVQNFSQMHIYIMGMCKSSVNASKDSTQIRHIFNCKFTIFIIYQPFSVLILSFVINLTGIRMLGDSGFLPFKMSLPT